MRHARTKELTKEKLRFTGSKLLFTLLLIVWPLAILYFLFHCETIYETKQVTEELSEEDLVVELE